VRGRTKKTVPTRRDQAAPDRAVFDEVGITREVPPIVMLDPSIEVDASDQDMRPRAKALSWMASMSVAAGELRAAEGYLLELLAWCAFADREPTDDVPADI
jgi:hypothetical protein